MTCRLIVLEKTNRWAAALRAALLGSRMRVLETRSLTGCESALCEAPASVVALEVTPANLDLVVDFVLQNSRRFPRAALVALLAEDAAGAEQAVREAGAIDAIGSVLGAPRIARLASRQFSLAPPPELSLQELVERQLPWATPA
jgi:hypothetical protein